MALKSTRKRFIAAIGAPATHSLQDGGTVGVLFGLSLTFPPAVALLFGVLGIEGVRPRKLIERADEIVRTEDIEDHPEYFLAGFLVGVSLGVVFGSTLSVVSGGFGGSTVSIGSLF